ncbi:MAG: hypothetical protein RLZZ232_1867 [Planctomycetota bacterium]|jgi:formylglycine-generating enzyme required for sulfatase activity
MASSSTGFDQELIKAISQRKLVPFIGAGVSIGVNKPRAKKKFPTWTQLLCSLAETLRTSDPTGADRVLATIRDKDLLAAADVALEKLGRTVFSDCVVRAVDFPDRNAFDLSLPKAIWSLNPSLVVTTNYDRVLQWSAEGPDTRIILNSAHAELRTIFEAADRPSIWHLHGYMDQKKSLILSPSQYRSFYSSTRLKSNEAARSVLGQLFSQHPILFIGFSMTDGYVLDAIAKAMTTFQGYTAPRWVLLKKGEQETQKLWRNFGVRVLEYEEHGQPLIDRIHALVAAVTTGKKSRRKATGEGRTKRPGSAGASAAELIQKADAQAMLGHWTRARKGEPLEGERHYLDVFVEPRISVRVEQTVSAHGRTEEKWETLAPGVDALLGEHFLLSDQWLVITEDAGGGKTVLSWLLAAALSQHAERFWVVRYEGRFPEDLRKDLEQRLPGRLSVAGMTQTAREVLDDLLTQRRVVVIYDALDQDNSSSAVERMHKLRHSVPDECLKTGLRLIVTSRPYAVNQHHTSVFQFADWRHCRLELFDEGQQTDYREQVQRLAESRTPGDGARVETAYGQLLPDREAVADLLAYPVVQSQIRSIIESQMACSGTGTLRPFRNTGDLYWEVANRLLDRAFRNPLYQAQSDEKANLLELLSSYGYLMMLWHRNFSVTAGEIPRIHREVQARFRGGQADWDRCKQILQATYLTDHLLLKENAERELSFPSLKMAEFFAGLYLGRYCDERVMRELRPEIGKGEWNNVWRFVAELPETTDSSGKTVCSVVSMGHSLQALFAVPDKGKLRPTESMFRAWQVLTRNNWLSEVREHVLTGWRQQFRRILIEGYEQGKPSLRARTAAEVVFEGDLTAFVESAVDPELARLRPRLDELDAIKRPDRQQKAELQTLTARYTKLDELKIEDWCQQLRPSFDTYGLCSDAKTGNPDRLTFMMGASDKDSAADKERETPWQKVIVPAFYMATACVTRAQYALFDPQRENVDSDFSEISPDPDCPMIYVNFRDGICFALWLDDSYSLPSEVQWEGAAWGGLDREQHRDYVIGVPPYTANFTSAQVNFDGNNPMRGPESEYRGRTVPVRFAEFQPNGFGLWQMSGNVWEYTRSEWHERLQDAIGHREDNLAGGSADAQRCVRGGSWYDFARYTRCSYRDWSYDRDYITGIRLSRTR